MQLRVRKKVFETNSSSSHALHSEPDDTIDANTTKDVLRKGVIEVNLRSFDQEWMRYYKLENKIAYLLVQACQGMIDGEANVKYWGDYLRNNSPKAEQLLALVEKITRCKVKVDLCSAGFAWIPHKQQGIASDLFESPEKMKTFLFSSKSYVQTRYDNNFCEEIDTDLGVSEPFYKSHYVSEAIGDTEFTIKFDDRWSAVEFDSNEVSLYADLNDNQDALDIKNAMNDVVIVGAKAFYEKPSSFYYGISNLHEEMADINDTSTGSITILDNVEVAFETDRKSSSELRPAGYVLQCVAPKETVDKLSEVVLDFASRGNVIR